MKTLAITLAACLAAILTLVSVVRADDAATPRAETTEIKLPTLMCGMCVKAISKAVKSVEGVSEVTVDRKEKLAKVTFDPAKTNLEALENAIVKAGYAANGKKADPEAFKKLPDCCRAPQ